MGPSHVSSAALSLVPSPMPSLDPSPDPSMGPSITPSPINSNMEDDGQGDEIDVNNQEDKLEDNVLEDDDIQDEDDSQEGDKEVVWSDNEEDDMDTFMEASRCELKEEIHLWFDLRVQIKADLEVAHKKKQITHAHQRTPCPPKLCHTPNPRGWMHQHEHANRQADDRWCGHPLCLLDPLPCLSLPAV